MPSIEEIEFPFKNKCRIFVNLQSHTNSILMKDFFWAIQNEKCAAKSKERCKNILSRSIRITIWNFGTIEKRYFRFDFQYAFHGGRRCFLKKGNGLDVSNKQAIALANLSESRDIEHLSVEVFQVILVFLSWESKNLLHRQPNLWHLSCSKHLKTDWLPLSKQSDCSTSQSLNDGFWYSIFFFCWSPDSQVPKKPLGLWAGWVCRVLRVCGCQLGLSSLTVRWGSVRWGWKEVFYFNHFHILRITVFLARSINMHIFYPKKVVEGRDLKSPHLFQKFSPYVSITLLSARGDETKQTVSHRNAGPNPNWKSCGQDPLKL